MRQEIRSDAKHTIQEAILIGHSTSELWLEYGFVGERGWQEMLWYNEGNASEIGTWVRAMAQKVQTNIPDGEMYFLMRQGDIKHTIVIDNIALYPAPTKE